MLFQKRKKANTFNLLCCFLIYKKIYKNKNLIHLFLSLFSWHMFFLPNSTSYLNKNKFSKTNERKIFLPVIFLLFFHTEIKWKKSFHSIGVDLVGCRGVVYKKFYLLLILKKEKNAILNKRRNSANFLKEKSTSKRAHFPFIFVEPTSKAKFYNLCIYLFTCLFLVQMVKKNLMHSLSVLKENLYLAFSPFILL